MDLLYKDRSEQDKLFIKEVCERIISTRNTPKMSSQEYCAVFFEGRNRKVNCLEDLASIYSFKVFSKYNYPVFCFVNNPKDFLGKDEKWLIDNRIFLIKIPEINSLEEYTKYCIFKLYFLLPKEIENVITLQPDGMLLKSGFENFIEDSKADWLSSHWRHFASVGISTGDSWVTPFHPVCIGNGGFSFRKASLMRKISRAYSFLNCKENGRNDDRPPMEDLFYSYFGFNTSIMNTPSLKDCDIFSCDPLTPKIFDSPNKPFGFHFFRNSSEAEWPECSHT